MTINTAGFNRQIAELQRVSGHTFQGTVRYWSFLAVRNLAYNTSLATVRHPNRGRLRAGWWPAAQHFGLRTVYAGTYPNKGEGGVVDNTTNPVKPSVIVTNSVPYGTLVKGMMARLEAGMEELRQRAKREAERDIKQKMPRFFS